MSTDSFWDDDDDISFLFDTSTTTPPPSTSAGPEWDLDVNPSEFLSDPKDTTLAEAQEDVLHNLYKGLHCPCCSKWVKIDKRTLNHTMALGLCWLVAQYERQGRQGWVDVPSKGPDWLLKTNQHASLRWWGLVERASNADPKKKHSGMWRPTSKGIAFAKGTLAVPKAVFVYTGVALQYDPTVVYLRDVLGVGFDYSETMKPAFLPKKRKITKR